jgi:hypothetical protein
LRLALDRSLETCPGETSPIRVFETVAGDQLSVAWPQISKEQEAALIDLVRDILEEEGAL